jgi:histidine phosphotransferase ChpT
LLNLLLIAGTSIPRGGTLTVDPVGEGEGMGFRVTAQGQYAKVQPAVEALLVNGNGSGEGVDAHAIQPHYTGLLAQNSALKLSLTTAPERIVLSAAAA